MRPLQQVLSFQQAGPPNRCKATPLWRGQRVNESSGNLYMRQSWLSPVNCKVNVILQCLLTLSNWTDHVHWTVQASLNIPFPRGHPRTYRLCQYADKTAKPLDWETYIALPSLPTYKSRQRQLLCLKQVQPYGLASCTALRTTLYRWLAAAPNDSEADSTFSHLSLNRETYICSLASHTSAGEHLQGFSRCSLTQ